MDTNVRRKDIIKNIAIIFLIIMLVLTFFSSTIMNRSLPQVAAQYAYSGQITTSVRANGTTTANENYKVILEEGRIIHSVEVRRGDKVNAGDLLFTLEEGDSTELQEAQDALVKAERDYEKWKQQTLAKLTDAELDIRYATEDLTRIKSRGISSTLDTSEAELAIRELEKKLGTYKRVDAELAMEEAEAAMHTAKAEMDAAQANVDAAKGTVDEAQAVVDASEGEIDTVKDAQKLTDKALKAAQKEYESKRDIYNELKGSVTSPSSEQLRQQLLSAERGIEDQTVELERLQKKHDDTQAELETLLENRKQLEKNVKTMQSLYDRAVGEESSLQDNIAFYQSIISRLSSLPELTEEEVVELANARGNLSFYQALLSGSASEQSELLGDLNEAKSKYNANETAIAQAEEQIKTMALSLEDKTRVLERAKADRDAIIVKIDEIESLPSEAEQQAAVDAAKAVMDNAEAAWEQAQEACDQAQSVIDRAQDSYDDAKAAYNDTVAAYESEKSAYETAKAAYNTAKAAYETAKAAYDTVKKTAKDTSTRYTRQQLDQLIEKTELELIDAREALEDLKKSDGAYTDGYSNYTAYVEAITSQQRTIDNKKNALERAKEESALEESSYTDAIARAKQTVERISETSGSNEIYAKVSGTINNIAVSAGQEIKSQTVLAEIEQTDRGYSVELTMTTEQAKRIAVGQTATILYYWGTTPEAVVESIKPSQSDPQNTRTVTLLVSGDITAGQSFTFSLGERSANYDNVVPSSAIREDSNGKFVLVVEAKNTPIGNRYTAVRRDVEVIAEDDTNAAVTGLTGGEFVITTSQTPISAGQQVRLSDN
ncbi:MAG: biotin/lipoyl-binding protein [Ruminococcaceae bacterium]|nr:biotin/lipoyl-binding protein [Oscillospiraceae bacterium]